MKTFRTAFIASDVPLLALATPILRLAVRAAWLFA